MAEDLKLVIEDYNVSYYIRCLSKKLKGKKVIIYGAGKLFEAIIDSCDLSNLNIVGIIDKKFENNTEDYFYGYKKYILDGFDFSTVDYILVMLQHPVRVISELQEYKSNKFILPILKKTLLYRLKKYYPIRKFLNRKTNTFVLIKKNGKRVYNPRIKNLTVKFWGRNNYVEIHEPFKAKQDVIISCFNNSVVKIAENNIYSNAEILVGTNNELTIGKNVSIGRAAIILRHDEYRKVNIGDECLISYDVTIRTGDAHTLLDSDGNIINHSEDVSIGDHVWIGANVTLLKGSFVPSNCVVGTYSLVNKKFIDENSLIAGIPAKVVKNNIRWDKRSIPKYC